MMVLIGIRVNKVVQMKSSRIITPRVKQAKCVGISCHFFSLEITKHIRNVGRAFEGHIAHKRKKFFFFSFFVSLKDK